MMSSIGHSEATQLSYDLEEITGELERVLPRDEFEHSLRSADYAVELARWFDLDEDKARVAGLVHDYAKGFSADALVATPRELGLEPDAVESSAPQLLHGPVGARLLPKRLRITDLEILRAVERHTLGAPGMTRFEKAIYLCDLLEPGRLWPELAPIRELAERDLDGAFQAAYAHTIEYLADHRRPIHPTTVAVWNWLVLPDRHASGAPGDSAAAGATGSAGDKAVTG